MNRSKLTALQDIADTAMRSESERPCARTALGQQRARQEINKSGRQGDMEAAAAVVEKALNTWM